MNKTNIAAVNYFDLIGLEDIKTEIQSIVRNVAYQMNNLTKRNNWHVFAFVGEHGTCKKTTGRALTSELYKLGAITKNHMEIIRVADLDIEKEKLNERLDSFEGLLYIRDSQSLEQRFSFNTGIDNLLDYLELNPPITVVIEFLTKHSFDTVMNRNARLYEVLNEDIINRPIDFINYCYSAEQSVDILRVMASHSKQIEEIGFVHPIVLDYAFEKVAMKVFEGIAKEKGGVNGIAIKDFFRACIDKVVCERTRFTEKTKIYLETKEDIPEKYRHYLGEPARIPQKELSFLPYHPSLTKKERLEKLKHCVVFVEAYRRNSSIPIQSTGIILTKSGYVLVANHCVVDRDLFRCRVYTPGAIGGDCRWFDAKLCNTDNGFEYDQALLKMDGTNFPCVPLMGENESILAGEELTIIGYPMGDNLSDHVSKLQPSVMSARLSSIQEKHGINRYHLANVIGYGGLSGGPCLNDDGKLVCIVQGQVQAFDSSNPYQIQAGMMYGTPPNLAAITEKGEAKISFSNENQEDYI